MGAGASGEGFDAADVAVGVAAGVAGEGFGAAGASGDAEAGPAFGTSITLVFIWFLF